MTNLPETTVDILDSTLSKITSVKEFIPLSAESILTYSKELSDFGQCKFRISSYDPLFATYGDILQPHQNHIRVNRAGTLVWSGAIIENTRRTKDYVEVIAAEYEWYLNKLLIRRSGLDPLGTAPIIPSTSTFNTTPTVATNDGSLTYLTFNQPIPFPVSIGQYVSLSNFSPSLFNGLFNVTAFTTTTLTLNGPFSKNPITVTTVGSVLFSDNIYRIFNEGTMGTQIGYFMDEVINTYQASPGNHPLANMTLGEIDTPNYPANITNNASPPVKLTGPYTFGNGINAPQMNFAVHTVFYVLASFGKVSYADFGIDENLVFNFLSQWGEDLTAKVSFHYSEAGNAVDFNWPRLGQQMANDIVGIATDINGNVLDAEQSDQASISTSGIIQQAVAFADVKDITTLNAALAAEIPLISDPNNSPITFTLNEKNYPLGVYDIGDIVMCSVTTDALTIAPQPKRIVGITVNINNQGREMITVQLNKPLPGQVGGSGVEVGGF